ncbi:hypothetical protein [Pelagibacterium lentulum]|uniref:Protease ydgD n=1 Tax=Pelagibacterium lentulum TaxID=2029865 RepID=A0A916VUJ7_9HYPH|nr:hypothetical protein [Pelagibacterium lentulum]GGA35833.1 hypothetical protein GCM10011499_01470 [Pelagibacterium lentulum]
MRRTRYVLGSSVLALTLMMAPAAFAQDVSDIDFGDDTSVWANDGECDDPRFAGEGTASILLQTDLGRDATDCRTAYEAGTVTYLGEDGAAAPAVADNGSATDISEIDFGDDSGTWANDGECDDPRFGGALESHRFADATDCRTAFEAGDVTYLGEGDAEPAEPVEQPDASEIDFGDDSGNWANDGECDDPRFGGGLQSHLYADATDCRAAFEAGDATYLGDQDRPEAITEPLIIDGIEFGDDSGNWSNDGECDDARFTGPGMGASLESHIGADASDCSAAYLAGTITLADEAVSGNGGDFRINFGDDSSASAFDGICDDPRFQGRGAALELYESNILADATDCRAAYDAGTVTYAP